MCAFQLASHRILRGGVLQTEGNRMSLEIRLQRRDGLLITLAEFENALIGLHSVRPAPARATTHAEVRVPRHAKWVQAFELWRGELIVDAVAFTGPARDKVNEACLILCERLDAAMVEVEKRAAERSVIRLGRAA
jgi:hypothetical protein